MADILLFLSPLILFFCFVIYLIIEARFSKEYKVTVEKLKGLPAYRENTYNRGIVYTVGEWTLNQKGITGPYDKENKTNRKHIWQNPFIFFVLGFRLDSMARETSRNRNDIDNLKRVLDKK